MPVPIPKKISQLLPTFQNVAQSSHYIVEFGLPNFGPNNQPSLTQYLRSKGVDDRFDLSEIGLMCSKAVLPGSAFATIDAVGEYQGIAERMPHTKKFVQMSLEFYVDNEYKALKFLEHWMEYISNGSGSSNLEDAYHYRMNYPRAYKSHSTKITKFEKNYRQSIEYGFRGLYPIELNSTTVQYQNSQVLKATASFNYDRYVCGKTTTGDVASRRDRNKKSASSKMVMGEGVSLLNPAAQIGVGNRDLIPARTAEEIAYSNQLGEKLFGSNGSGSPSQNTSENTWFDA